MYNYIIICTLYNVSTLLLLNRVASAIRESALTILSEQKKGMNRQAMYMYTGTCICTCSVSLHLNFKLLCYCTKKNYLNLQCQDIVMLFP